MLNAIAVDITNYCNFDCLHCLRDQRAPKAHLKPELLEFVIKEISSIGMKDVNLTGGEPALHPNLKRIFRLFREYGIRFNLVSNGYLFLENILPLLDAKTRPYFTGACFSLDGSKAASHDKTRKKGSFKRVIKSIKTCISEGIPVSVKSIIHKKNLDEIRDTALLCASLGVDNLGFIILDPTPRLITSGLMPSPREYMDVIKYIKGRIIPAFAMPIGIEGYSDPEFKASFCNPAYGLSMDHEGNLIFCCNLSHPTAGDKPDALGKEFLGNIKEIGIEEGILRHYRLLGWFMAKVLDAGDGARQGGCLDCFQIFGKLEWIKDYETPYDRNC